jgi:hypothetical protein
MKPLPVARCRFQNPSRDYSAFLPLNHAPGFMSVHEVSNPSRDYSAFLHPHRRSFHLERIGFKPSRIILHFYQGRATTESESELFQTSPGLFCISTFLPALAGETG